MNEKEITVFKYMNLRVKGIGVGLTNREINILNNIPDVEWKGITQAIKDYGGIIEDK